ncbi:hypothetical protein PC114_g20777 [Phytophthora cactorum]|uniref:Uncharacterized protein n=1 Tax=Phytophthora cactorum TaxID=29920 RepID=A0A8T1BNN3_9STRA|nr:hypothetical protein PC114_g20777 [Phytophthora cactorum]KAG2906264.1 hypothetical protein PC117_g20552 [Phytophthora cactorum]
MATEALRRLREEIDAAFEAQRRPSNEKRVVVNSPKTLTPKWAEVTALLASIRAKHANYDKLLTSGMIKQGLH